MRNWFRKRRAREESAAEAAAEDPVADSPWVRMQSDYWTFDAAEKGALLARYRDGGLDWPETLRLHHLACLELLDTPAGRAMLSDPDADPPAEDPARAAEETRLCRELAERLRGPSSPYAPLDAVVWQGETLAGGAERPPDRFTRLSNASLTHLGSLEVIRLDAEGEPAGLAFVPFARIVYLHFLAPPSGFRHAVLATPSDVEGAEDTEVVVVPLLYATSWRPEAGEIDRSGAITRFCFAVPVPGAPLPLGIGVGLQDLLMETGPGGPSLAGLSSVAAFSAAEPA